MSVNQAIQVQASRWCNAQPCTQNIMFSCRRVDRHSSHRSMAEYNETIPAAG